MKYSTIFFSLYSLFHIIHSIYIVSIKYVNSFVFITLAHIHIVFPKLIANARNKSKIRIDIQKRKKKIKCSLLWNGGPGRIQCVQRCNVLKTINRQDLFSRASNATIRKYEFYFQYFIRLVLWLLFLSARIVLHTHHVRNINTTMAFHSTLMLCCRSLAQSFFLT